MEKDLTAGKPIADFFDMIAGTFTGGIMALAAGLKIPASRIETLYREDGRHIFR
jgi:patatin-like phospholipase/acyl hydrolase